MRKTINGLIVSLPFIVIIAILVFLIRFIARILTPFAKLLGGSPLPKWSIYFVAFVLVLFLFFAFGVFLSTRKGDGIFTYIETRLFKNIPLYSTVKNVIKQFRGEGKRPFREVVLVDMYDSGCYMTAFIVEYVDDEYVVVYVPTAPNPTNGFVIIVKEAELIKTDAKTEDAMATVIGIGSGAGEMFKEEMAKYKRDR